VGGGGGNGERGGVKKTGLKRGFKRRGQGAERLTKRREANETSRDTTGAGEISRGGGFSDKKKKVRVQPTIADPEKKVIKKETSRKRSLVRKG